MIQGIRRTDGSTETPGGNPLPLTGKPLTEIPVVLAQDLTCINVTPEQIVMRQAQTGLLHWTPPGPKEEGPPKLDARSPGPTEDFATETILPPEG